MKKTENTCIRNCANVTMINRNISNMGDLETFFNSASFTFSLFGNNTRLKILYVIQSEKKVCVCDLSDILGISVSAISQQLKKLKVGKLLLDKKEGQTIFYFVHPKAQSTIQMIFQLMLQIHKKAA